MTKKGTVKSDKCRHKYGPLQERSFEDGSYQACLKCGRVRFQGDRQVNQARNDAMEIARIAKAVKEARAQGIREAMAIVQRWVFERVGVV